jgi:hypothetical protein
VTSGKSLDFSEHSFLMDETQVCVYVGWGHHAKCIWMPSAACCKDGFREWLLWNPAGSSPA